ncbi:tetratricopeptide repeat protein [Desulfovibrio inopinatus]|uniref:tetratricopeptide repeat protein n=1 Tax=Desulfovibrio inopinatus TaxID=102109 RepID=UPI00041354B8|nr:hypothetical protein [Desulfovibrio inopinatus]
MSTELIKARTNLSQVNSFLKQQKFLPAVNSLYEALLTILKNPLMKAEREEFSKLIDKAVYVINSDRKLRELYPLALNYEPGQERALAESLRTLVHELETTVLDEARDKLASLEQQKREGLEKAQNLLNNNLQGEAKTLLARLVKDYPEDSELRANIAEMLIKAEMYEEAFDYLDQALSINPEQIKLYNSIGIVLRKLRKFELAEKYFMRAVSYAKQDSNLYFNIGRLYLDWERWDKVAKAAKLAIKYRPDFVEAQKMLTFAEKKLAK